MKNKIEIPVLSFFTGGGFLDIGFEQAGFKVVWSNEANPVFAELYAYGMTAWKKENNKEAGEHKITSTKQIESLTSPEIIKTAFPEKRPKLFGIIGGPPCPDFSTGGRNEGGEGLNGRLSKTYVNRICKIEPSFFVFENVAGLYRTKIHREFLTKLEYKLEKKGYCLDLKILSALELGVPQDRERLIIIGMKRALAKKCLNKKIEVTDRGWFNWPQMEYKDAKTKYKWPDIVVNGMAPSKPKDIPEKLTVHYWIHSLDSMLENTKDIFKAKSGKFQTIKEGDTKRKSFKKLHRYRYSPTVCYGHNEVHLHPWEKRRLSVREAMRIQGIPDSYVLPEKATLSSKFTIVSNGVPVPLAHAVAKSLKEFLDKRP
jgi:DNA (cytosine-5)-methyltransferase 1